MSGGPFSIQIAALGAAVDELLAELRAILAPPLTIPPDPSTWFADMLAPPRGDT